MARSASARSILLALAAVAAISLAGCGGGGSDDGAGSATGSEAQGAAATTTTSSAKGQGGDSSASAAPSGSAQSESTTSPGDTPSPGKGKHGKPIQLPEGEPEPQATPAQEAKATVADVVLTSPSLGAGESVATLPATYTCDGKGTWPALQWQGIPTDTQELILFAMNAAPVEGKLFFDWAVAGLPGDLSGLEEGKLPKGAVQGQNSVGKTGYEICPAQGQTETYVFALYAIPTRLSPAKGFDPHGLREEALAAVGHAGLLAVSAARG